MSIRTISPTTEEVLETFELSSQEQIDAALQEVHQAFLSWRARPSFQSLIWPTRRCVSNCN